MGINCLNLQNSNLNESLEFKLSQNAQRIDLIFRFDSKAPKLEARLGGFHSPVLDQHIASC